MRPDQTSSDALTDRISEHSVEMSRSSQRILTAKTEPVFLCPGQSQPVSRAVHLARLNAAWSVCDQCEWRHHSEGLATATIEQTERIREHRIDSLRRTEFGVRGPFVNALDRSVAADLARVFCRCFAEFSGASAVPGPLTPATTKATRLKVAFETRLAEDPPKELSMAHVQPVFADISPIVLGYDGRSSSLDLFAGVLAAVREFGFPVIDIGRCTAASLTAAVRAHDSCAGMLFVTGSGSPGSWNGLDAMDVDGDPIPVLWKDFSIRLHHAGGDEPSRVQVASSLHQQDLQSREDSAVDELLRRIRGELADQSSSADSASVRTSVSTSSATRLLRLELPDAELRRQWSRRLSRESGVHQIIEFESTYRDWLATWFPDSGESRILVRSDDSLVCERVEWLRQRTAIELVPRGTREQSDIPACRLSISIDEDDRSFRMLGRRGETIEPERLALLINRATQATKTHVSAHGDNASGRFWLTDSVRFGAGLKTHRVRDALAVLGFVMRLVELGHLNL